MLEAGLLYITLAVSDLDRTAKLLASHGFLLKKPHEYKMGDQKGMITQSILFKEGTSLQLVSLKNKESKSLGPLAKWYQKKLKKGEGGETVVLSIEKIKEATKNLESVGLSSFFRLQKHPNYHWLSAKTDSPYQHLSFMKWISPPQFNEELFNHPNQVTGIKKVTLRPKGDPKVLHNITKATGAMRVGLDFTGLQSTGGHFIESVTLLSSLKPLPKSFKLGTTEVKFQSTFP